MSHSDTTKFLTAEGLTFRIDEYSWTPNGDNGLPAWRYTAHCFYVMQVAEATMDAEVIGEAQRFECGPQRAHESGRDLTYARALDYVNSQFSQAKSKRLVARA